MAVGDLVELEVLKGLFAEDMRQRDDSARLFRSNKDFRFVMYLAETPVLLGMIEAIWLHGPFLHFSLGVRGRWATRNRPGLAQQPYPRDAAPRRRARAQGASGRPVRCGHTHPPLRQPS
jgi:hypothetical protein